MSVRREEVAVLHQVQLLPGKGSLQPVAIGAAVEVTKPSKPSRKTRRLAVLLVAANEGAIIAPKRAEGAANGSRRKLGRSLIRACLGGAAPKPPEFIA